MANKKKTTFNIDYYLKIIAVLLLLATILNIFTNFNLMFNSDTATANLLAKEQMFSKKLFPDDWNYGTGIWIFFFNILIIPLSFFSNNQILLRNISVLIVLIVFIIFLYLLIKKKLKSNSWLILLCLLFSNTSTVIIEVMYAQAAYLPSLLEMVILLYLFFNAFDNNFNIKSKRFLISIIIYIVYLSLIGTISIAYYIIPILGSVVVYFVIENYSLCYTDFKLKIKGLCRVTGTLISSMILGRIAYKALLSKVNFDDGANIIYAGANDIIDAFARFILIAIGYSENVELFSLAGIMNFVKISMFVFLIVCCILLFKKYREQSFEIKIVINFSVVAVIVQVFFCFTVYSKLPGSERYLVRPLFLVYLLASYYIYHYMLTDGFISRLIVLIIVIVFSIPNTVATIPNIINYKELHSEQTGLIQYLADNNLEYGYSSFWNAYNNTVLSDFDITINAVNFTDKIEPYYWLNSRRYYKPEIFNGKTFLLMTEEETQIFDINKIVSLIGKPESILSYNKYYIYIYNYNIAERAWIS